LQSILRGLEGSVWVFSLLVYNYIQKTLKARREAPKHLKIDSSDEE